MLSAYAKSFHHMGHRQTHWRGIPNAIRDVQHLEYVADGQTGHERLVRSILTILLIRVAVVLPRTGIRLVRIAPRADLDAAVFPREAPLKIASLTPSRTNSGAGRR